MSPADMVDNRAFVTVQILEEVIIAALIIGVVALLYAGVLAWLLLSKPTGTAAMVRIADSIEQGAGAYLRREYISLLFFVIPAAAAVGGINWDKGPGETVLSFLTGAVLSGLTGWIGMKIAVKANVRTTAAAMDAKNGLSAALRVAFSSGTVMGMSVVGFGLVGVSALTLIIHHSGTNFNADPKDPNVTRIWDMLAGYAFGASSIALFARVGGGIYTKAADVGADLVGKVEAGIPEDDPRNPGVIADNVGDNVGDVAGMGADLFESYCGSIIAACTLGNGLRGVPLDQGGLDVNDYQAVALPFLIAMLGILASVIGGQSVRTGEGATQTRLLWSMRIGVAVASVLHIIALCVTNFAILQIKWEYTVCVFIGLIAGVLIGYFTEYATSFAYRPTQGIARAGITGPATVIIEGLGVGQLSTLPPVVIVCATIVICMRLGQVYGVSIAAVGMLATLGVTLSTDAYGPVADNAGGIAEMAELDADVRERTDALDALGNTTAATGKGFAIGSAVLTALALMGAFSERVGDSLSGVSLISTGLDTSIFVLPGIIFGTMLPFLFSALTMLAVGKSATAIIQEVRRQFHEIPGLMEGNADADYARCVAISTSAALREMVMPGFLAVITPFIVGLGFGPEALLGMLIGAIASGFLLAVMMANAGGAWDNSKKWVESGESGLGGKGTDLHAAVVTGDTVGDPFKDTSGPSLNILIKLTSIVALVMAPAFRNTNETWWISLIVVAVALIFIVSWTWYLRKSTPQLDFSANQQQQQQQHSHQSRSSDRSRHGSGRRHGGHGGRRRYA